MKFFILLFLAALSCWSCTKNATEEDSAIYINGNGLVGKWKAVEQFISPGIGGSWNALAQEKRFVIEFKADSSFAYSANFPKADSGFVRYSTNSTLINVRNSGGTKADAWYYNPDPANTLDLGVFQCYEGCAYRLRRIQ